MKKIAEKRGILEQVIGWYLSEVPKNIIKAWKNFLAFGLDYFSIFLLFKTFFSYWHRYKSSYGRGFDLKRYFEAASFNLISRALGAFVRSIFIVVGIAVEICLVFLGLAVFTGWFLLPFLISGGFLFGVRLLVF